MKTFVSNISALALVGCLVVPTSAKADDWYFSGYVKSYLVAQTDANINGPIGDAAKPVFQSQNAARIMIAGPGLLGSDFEFHYEVKPIFSTQSMMTGSVGFGSTIASTETKYRVGDINPSFDDGDEKTGLLQNLDRLNLQFREGIGTITVGRQPVAFGSARFLSPTDILEPFLVSTLDQEYRVGVDAVRFEKSLGPFKELDLGIIAGSKWRADHSAAYARYKSSMSGNDVEVTTVLQNRWAMLGGGIERAIGNLGFWGEVAYVHSLDGRNYTRLSTGLDKSFGDNILGMIEYHYSGAGSNDPADYVVHAVDEAFTKGGVFLAGDHYVVPAVTWTVTPLLGVTASAFVNFSDDSAFLRFGGEYSLSEDIYMDFGINAAIGRGGEAMFAPPYLTLGSEFGSVPSTAYVSLRRYF